MDVPVDAGDQRLDFRGRDVVVHQCRGHFDLRRLDLAQAVDAIFVRQPLNKVHGLLRGNRESGGQVDQADRLAPAVDDGHVAPPEAAHGGDGGIEKLVLRDCLYRRGHDVAYSLLPRAPQRDAPRYVLFGDDTAKTFIGVDDESGGGFFTNHVREQVLDGGRVLQDDARPAMIVAYKTREDLRLGLHVPCLAQGDLVAEC